MITRYQLSDYYQALLRPETYADYCPNGLQIEGAEHIERIAFAVSATRDSISQAVENKAHALVVHHGLFWTFHGAKPLTGTFARRVFPLITSGINLFGYHLPLDGHPDIGNAAVLGQLIDCNQQQPFGDYKGSATGIKGVLEQPLTAIALQRQLEAVLQHNVILATPDSSALIRSVGIITGGANSEWRLVEKEHLDAYITGEISEHDWHESQEAGIHMFAGGHNATEQFGIRALMERTQQQFAVECFFIDSENPA
ncbi:MAG: Nif3-like dinuclear metal center hexameric protein [Methylobacter sp.]